MTDANPSPATTARFGLFHVLAASLIVTGLNALKPPIIDDGLYIDLARHISTHFLDPYGFHYLWFQWKEPAIHVTSPVVLSYWMAVCIRLLGDGFVLLKLWNWPWALLMAWALWKLLSRWMEREREPIFWMTMLSAFLLPGINLMLDFPTEALVLASLYVFTTAVDRSSAPRALFAGLLAGLAMQTKYTGFIAPALLLAYGLVFLRPGLGAIGGACGVCIFALWEYAMLAKYGTSFFIDSMGSQASAHGRMALLAQGLVTIIGLLGAGLGLLSLRLMRSPRGLLAIGGALMLLPLALAPWASVPLSLIWVIGILIWALIVVAIAPGPALWIAEAMESGAVRWFRGLPESRRVQLFLYLWLAIELVLFFAISPFPAARRLIGLSLVLTFILGQSLDLADRTARGVILLGTDGLGVPELDARLNPASARKLRERWLVAGLASLVGLLVASADIVQAMQYRLAFDTVAARIRQADPDRSHRVLFNVVWNGKYDGPRTGMIEAVPEESIIDAGDWLVVATKGLESPSVRVTAQEARPAFEVDLKNPFRVDTNHYFAGLYPYAHETSPIAVLSVVQAKRSFLLRSSISPEMIEALARSTRFVAPPASVDVLADAMLTASPEIRDLLAGKIAATGLRDYVRLLRHPDPRIRDWVLSMMGDQPMSGDWMLFRERVREVAERDSQQNLRDKAQRLMTLNDAANQTGPGPSP